MKQIALCVLLASTTVACAASKTTLPQPASSAPTEATPEAEAEQDEPTDLVAVSSPHSANDRWLGAAASSELVLVGGQEQYVGVWVDVPEGQQRAHVPMALTLTIDTSGSMGGDKIVQARAAAKVLVQNMKDGDLVSIHAFSGTAHELIPPTVLRPRSRQAVISTIAELSADGATNMYDALNLSIGRARRAPATHPVRRVVMISDGRATAGPTSTATLAQVAENGTAHGVQVTALGVGLDYDEDALNAVAVRSSGRLYHLSDPREMAGIIRSELGLLQSTMAVGAYVEMVPAPGVQLIGASGVRSHWGSGGSLRVPLGTLFSGQRRELLVRYRWSGGFAEGQHPIASARLHFTDPNDSGVQRVQEVVVRGTLSTDADAVAAQSNAEVQAIIAVQEAANTTSQARVEVTAGNFDQADQQLAHAELQLRQQAAQQKTKRDQQRVMAAAENIARSRRSVRAAAKAPPAARPKAARASSLKLNDFAMEAMGY